MSSNVSISWRGKQVADDVDREMELRVQLACEVVAGDVRRSIRTPYPPASQPYNPPHTRRYQLGLLGSIYVDVQRVPGGIDGYVGSNMKHALHLELGTSRMKPRPSIRPALYRNRSGTNKILTRPLRVKA